MRQRGGHCHKSVTQAAHTNREALHGNVSALEHGHQRALEHRPVHRLVQRLHPRGETNQATRPGVISSLPEGVENAHSVEQDPAQRLQVRETGVNPFEHLSGRHRLSNPRLKRVSDVVEPRREIREVGHTNSGELQQRTRHRPDTVTREVRGVHHVPD